VISTPSAWRGEADELDPEASEVEDHGAEHVDIGFAGVATARTDLPEFQ